MRRAAFAAIVCCAALIGIAPPCFACSCIASTDAEHYSRADVVFTGRATARHDPNEGSSDSAEPIHWTFDRESTQKGTVPVSPVVTTTRDEASCGFPFVLGRRYQVFAQQVGSEFETNLCGGTRELSASQQPYAPPAATPPPQPPAAPPVTPAPETPTPTTSRIPNPAPMASPAATPAASVPDVTATNDEDTSAVPGVIALLASIAALGTAVWFARTRADA